MATMQKKSTRRKGGFKQTEDLDNPYKVGSESLTISEKIKILDEIGQPELVELFKNWKPRQVRKRKRGAPLDQRVAITVTNEEKVILDKELKAIKAAGEKTTTSQFIRNRALGTVDVQEWKNRALAELEDLIEIEENKTSINKRKRQLVGLLEESDDQEDIGMFEIELTEINQKLASILARSTSRKNRLSGRMSMSEAEAVKWRAQRLCLSTSDYLRMVIFGLTPASPADAHMSLDARKRFYVAILDIAENGWGSPPNVYECSQCVNYVDEIEKLNDRIEQLETFV